MTEHHNVVAEKICDEIVDRLQKFSNLEQISIYNEILERIDDELRLAMQQEYNITDEDWND
jgi:hypothetical protein